ncbi:MAG: hypothetical protein QW412_03400 [Candidatus Aenigmatarchaeota archaeon]
MINSSELLKRIKNGSISEYLKCIYEIEKMNLKNRKEEFLSLIIENNKKCILPKTSDFKFFPELYESLKNLKNRGLIFDVTIPELLNFFNEIKNYKPHLPEKLNYATGFEIEKMRGRYGSCKSWTEKMENPRAPYYKRFYIALVCEKGVPVFVQIFSFLDTYNYYRFDKGSCPFCCPTKRANPKFF